MRHLAPLLAVLALPTAGVAQPISPTAEGRAQLDAIMSRLPPTRETAPVTLSLAVTESIEADPDLAIVSGGVSTLAPTATEALRQNSEAMERVIAAVRRAGLAEADVQTTGIGLTAQYDYENRRDGQPPRFTGYQASNRVELRVRDIARLGGFLDSLVTAGATDLNGPTFVLEKSDELEAQARLKTVARAQTRADAYARTAGFRSARLTGISESGAPGAPPMPYGEARIQTTAARAVPVSPGRVRSEVTVNFTFLLER